MSKIKIITGHFGSGKTEIAVNMAIEKKNVTIVDLDTVNPYFRTADAAKRLKELGVRVILPEFANTNIDMPTLPAEIYSVFQSDQECIFDVGGDDEGAVALGMFNCYFLESSYEMYFVVNASRPFTKTVKDVIYMMGAIENSSRLKITHLVNNTHLAQYTKKEDILKGQDLCKKVSERTGIPIAFTAVRRDLAPIISNIIDNPIMVLDLYINLPF